MSQLSPTSCCKIQITDTQVRNWPWWRKQVSAKFGFWHVYRRSQRLHRDHHFIQQWETLSLHKRGLDGLGLEFYRTAMWGRLPWRRWSADPELNSRVADAFTAQKDRKKFLSKLQEITVTNLNKWEKKTLRWSIRLITYPNIKWLKAANRQPQRKCADMRGIYKSEKRLLDLAASTSVSSWKLNQFYT